MKFKAIFVKLTCLRRIVLGFFLKNSVFVMKWEFISFRLILICWITCLVYWCQFRCGRNRPRFVTQMSTLTSKSEPETKKASTEISRSNWDTKKKSMTYKRFVPIASGSLLTWNGTFYNQVAIGLQGHCANQLRDNLHCENFQIVFLVPSPASLLSQKVLCWLCWRSCSLFSQIPSTA